MSANRVQYFIRSILQNSNLSREKFVKNKKLYNELSLKNKRNHNLISKRNFGTYNFTMPPNNDDNNNNNNNYPDWKTILILAAGTYVVTYPQRNQKK